MKMAEVGFLTLRDAAKWSGVSTKTLERWIVKGLPVYRSGPGTKRLLRTLDIDQFLTRQQVSPPDLNQAVDDVLRELSSKGGHIK